MTAPMPLAPPVMRTTLFSSCKCMAGRSMSVKVFSVLPEDFFPLCSREILHVFRDQAHNLVVARGQQADWPIRAKHHAVHAKQLKDQVQVRFEVISSPALPVGF